MSQGSQRFRFWIAEQYFDAIRGLFAPVFDAWVLAEEEAGFWLETLGLGDELAGLQAVWLKREFVTAVAVVSSEAPPTEPRIGFGI